MMTIQWFPGHMAKAMRMMQDAVKQVDCVIYVLDSRAVMSCMNPKFDELIKNKPILYVLNKCDMVDSNEIKKWRDWFVKRGKSVVVADSIGGKQRKLIVEKLKEINKAVVEKFASKGANKIIRAMVIGVPNTGKSTLINSLCQSKRAITGNRAGVTRGKQWVSLAEGVELLDTPGNLPPAFEEQKRALHLAFLGSIKEDILHIDELAIEMINFCREYNAKAFMERYKLQEFSDDNLEVFDAISKNRGYLLGKKGYDYERTERAIIDDFQKQKLGKLMLDRAEDWA